MLPNITGYSQEKCHEMVIEMSPWSSSLGLNKMVADPFFCFSRSGGFCYDSASNSPNVAIRAMVGAIVGISRPSQRDMLRDFARYATASRFWGIFTTIRLLIYWHIAL
jgi:hypothetical protein